MQQKRVLDIIVNLLTGYKNNNVLTDVDSDGEETTLYNCGYLLNQTIRQYKIKESHIFVSEKALLLWKKIRNDDIRKYTYRNNIIKENDMPVSIDKYKGATKEPYEKNYEIKQGKSFVFNDVFTDEHVVTVSDIIKELCSLPTCNTESVRDVLNNRLYICKMLKSEDWSIAKRKKRSSLDYREIIINEYKEAGVLLADFDYKKAYTELIEEYKEKLKRLQ